MNEFLRLHELHIHVGIHTLQGSVVFHAPFELHHDIATRQIQQKGFGIDNKGRLKQ